MVIDDDDVCGNFDGDDDNNDGIAWHWLMVIVGDDRLWSWLVMIIILILMIDDHMMITMDVNFYDWLMGIDHDRS